MICPTPLVAAAILATIAFAPAVAQSGGGAPPPPRAIDLAFQAMLRDLADPDLSFRYARLATEAGEVPGAVAALERLLLLNPKLDNIRLELALFYQRLGNPGLARAYAERALASPDMPAAIRPRAERLLAEIDRGLSRHSFTAEFGAGARHDTNVNAGPSSQTVRGGGIDIAVVAGQPDADTGLFASASGQYAYDLGGQRRERIDVNGYAYGLRYLDRGDYDLDVLALDAGVWSYPFEAEIGVRPYLTYTHVGLERRTYLKLPGGGLALQAPVGPAVAEVTAQARLQDYGNSARRPAATDQDGIETTVGASLAWQPAPQHLLLLQGTYVVDDADQGYVANHDRGIALTWRLSGPSPLLAAASWTLALSGRYRDIAYDEPDPLVDPAVTRHDRRREFLVVGTLPVWRALAVVVSYQRIDNDSNLQNYAYANNAVWMNLSWRH